MNEKDNDLKQPNPNQVVSNITTAGTANPNETPTPLTHAAGCASHFAKEYVEDPRTPLQSRIIYQDCNCYVRTIRELQQKIEILREDTFYHHPDDVETVRQLREELERAETALRSLRDYSRVAEDYFDKKGK